MNTFSAHVIQHFLLALVIPPLLLLATPQRFAEAVLQRPALAKLERILGQPPISWLLGVGTMLAWHIPALFSAAMTHEVLHTLQKLTFLVTGVIFWWPILAPLENRRLQALPAVSYLFSACVCCSLLGAFLTFSPAILYPAYLNRLDSKSDQQMGGLLMWVPGCFVYLSAILSAVLRWYDREGMV